MIPDTIHFRQRRKYVPDGKFHDNWKVRRSEILGDSLDGPRFGISASHRKIKHLKMHGSGDVFEKVEIPSLQQVGRGHNGMVADPRYAIPFYYEILDQILSEISEPLACISEYRRLDVSTHMKALFSEVLPFLRGINLPRARKAPSMKDERSIRFTRNGLQIEFYDKVAQLREKRNHVVVAKNVIRCEVRAMNPKMVAQVFGEEMHKTGPTDAMLQAAMCTQLEDFLPEEYRQIKIHNIYDFLAKHQRTLPDLLEDYLNLKKPATRPDVRRKVKKAAKALVVNTLPLKSALFAGMNDTSVNVIPILRNGDDGNPQLYAPYRMEELRELLGEDPVRTKEGRPWGSRMHPFEQK